MSKEIKVEIISPEGSLFEGSGTMVVIPSVNGEMGILHGHELVLARLKEGKISIFNGEKNLIKELEITTGGFAKLIKEDRLLILVDGQ
ncbi:MAG: hypothetical protein O3B09_00350 [Proteobacteria bacterium]|nr:hypothetical protein [Pseudomonadota bacterium]